MNVWKEQWELRSKPFRFINTREGREERHRRLSIPEKSLGLFAVVRKVKFKVIYDSIKKKNNSSK